MEQLVGEIDTKAPPGLPEQARLAGTPKCRKRAYLPILTTLVVLLDLLEHLWGIALGFKNLANHIARSLL